MGPSAAGSTKDNFASTETNKQTNRGVAYYRQTEGQTSQLGYIWHLLPLQVVDTKNSFILHLPIQHCAGALDQPTDK